MATRQPAVVIILMLAHLAMPVAGAAQAGNVPRIGILELASPSASVRGHKAFQKASVSLATLKGRT
jgi:hypothetical protein